MTTAPQVFDRHSEFDLRHIGRVLRQRLWWILAFGLVVAAGVYAYMASKPNLYEATSEVRVVDSSGTPLLTGQRIDADRQLENELHRMQSGPIRGQVGKALGKDAQAIRRVTTEAVPGTDIAQIRIVSTSPEVAASAANQFAQLYVENRQAELADVLTSTADRLRETADTLDDQIGEIDSQLQQGQSQADIDVLTANRAAAVQSQSQLRTQAVDYEVDADLRKESVAVVHLSAPPTKPFEPQPRRDATIAGLLAMILAAGISVIVDWLDNRIKSPSQVEQITEGIPVIGSIPMHERHYRRNWRRKPPDAVHSLAQRSSPAAEAYRTLQTSIRFSSLGKTKQRIAITSASAGEGKTTITANLAMALAEVGMRVVVVSADLRRPRIGGLFGVEESEKGLTAVLLGDADLAECLIPIKGPTGHSFALLPTGPLPHNPAALLGSEEFDTLLGRIESARIDFVLLDCAPVLPVSDALAVAQHVDGVLITAVADQTHEGDLAQTVDRLRQVEAEIIGVVLNGVPHRKGTLYGYYGYYGEYDPEAPMANGDNAPRGWLRRMQQAITGRSEDQADSDDAASEADDSAPDESDQAEAPTGAG